MQIDLVRRWLESNENKKKSVICLKSENLHKHRGTAEDKMSIMVKKANNLSLTNFSFEIATFFIPRDKAVVGQKWPKDRYTG